MGNRQLMSRRDFESHPDACNHVWSDCVETKGGLTKVEVTSPQGRTIEAQAQCNELDNYNRRLGVKIALGRAMAKLKESESN